MWLERRSHSLAEMAPESQRYRILEMQSAATFSSRLLSVCLLAAFAFTVLGSTEYLHLNVVWLYAAKHGSLILVAALALTQLFPPFFLNVRPSMDSLLLCLCGIPYLLQGQVGFLLAAQLVVTVIASIAFRKLWTGGTIFWLRWPLALIALLPAFVDWKWNAARFIYNDVWGRNRLLLGYFHPKEAGLAFLLVFMLFKLRSPKLLSRVDLIAIPALWLIQSRNALLFYLNFILISALFKTFTARSLAVILIVLYVLLPATFLILDQQAADIALSERLTQWSHAGELLSGQADFNIGAASGIAHVDNYYLEYFILNGAGGLVLLIAVLLLIAIRLGKQRTPQGTYRNAIYLSFLFYCFFDASMFSTGNFINFLALPIVFAGEHAGPIVKFRLLPVRFRLFPKGFLPWGSVNCQESEQRLRT